MVAPAEYVFPIKQNIEAAAAAGPIVEKLLLGNTNIGKIHQSGSNKLPKDKLLVWLFLVFSNFYINVCTYFDIRSIQNPYFGKAPSSKKPSCGFALRL